MFPLKQKEEVNISFSPKDMKEENYTCNMYEEKSPSTELVMNFII